MPDINLDEENFSHLERFSVDEELNKEQMFYESQKEKQAEELDEAVTAAFKEYVVNHGFADFDSFYHAFCKGVQYAIALRKA